MRTPATFTGARSFNRRVKSEQIGLARDVVDELHHVADLLRGLGKRLDCVVGGVRLLDRLGGDLGRLSHLTADLGDRARQLLGRTGDGLDVGRGLLRGRQSTAVDWRCVSSAVADIDCEVAFSSLDAVPSALRAPPTDCSKLAM